MKKNTKIPTSFKVVLITVINIVILFQRACVCLYSPHLLSLSLSFKPEICLLSEYMSNTKDKDKKIGKT